MEQIPFIEANSCLFSQENRRILWNPMTHHRIHKSWSLVPFLIQMNVERTPL
jgi:hypothetical protein